MADARELERLVRIILENDPDEPVSDAGHTVLDAWREEARRALSDGPMTSPVVPPRHLSAAEAAAIVAEGEDLVSRLRAPLALRVAEAGWAPATLMGEAATRIEALTDALRRARVSVESDAVGPSGYSAEAAALLAEIDTLLGGPDA